MQTLSVSKICVCTCNCVFVCAGRHLYKAYGIHKHWVLWGLCLTLFPLWQDETSFLSLALKAAKMLIKISLYLRLLIKVHWTLVCVLITDTKILWPDCSLTKPRISWSLTKNTSTIRVKQAFPGLITLSVWGKKNKITHHTKLYLYQITLGTGSQTMGRIYLKRCWHIWPDSFLQIHKHHEETVLGVE